MNKSTFEEQLAQNVKLIYTNKGDSMMPLIKQDRDLLIIEPANGSPYVDRTGEFPCKIDENDLCYKAFTSRGFSWGGSWRNSKDYQHFEVPTEVIRTWYPDYGT